MDSGNILNKLMLGGCCAAIIFKGQYRETMYNHLVTDALNRSGDSFKNTMEYHFRLVKDDYITDLWD